MRTSPTRLLRWTASIAAVLLVVTAGAAQGQSDDAAAPMRVAVVGLSSGDVVTTEMLEFTVTPIGYELSSEGMGAAVVDGRGHYHLHIDGALRGVYATENAVVDLGELAPGPHTITILPAGNDHTEMSDGAVAITIDYRPAAGSAEPERTITVSLQEWLLDPSELTLTAGTYTFVAPNDGAIDHSLAITGQDLSASTPDAAYGPGVSQSFTVDLKPGTYELLCPLPWHRRTGMVGAITVVP